MNTIVLLLLYAFMFLCNTKEIRFCSIGMGPFGKFTAKAAIQKGFKMVAAFTRYSKQKEYVNQLLGITDDESLSFLVSSMDKLEQIIDKSKPHFCIDATNDTLQGIYPHLLRLIAKNVHILTLSDEAAYPNTRFDIKTQQIYQSLNDFAKQNNVVILGGGFSDSILLPIIPSIAASMQTVSTIKLSYQQNIENRTKALAETYGVGLTESEFNAKAKKQRFFVWQRSILQSIADSINHPILSLEEHNKDKTLQVEIKEECYKCEDKNGVYSKLIEREIRFGHCVGSNTTVIAKAIHNVTIIFSIIYAVAPNANQFNDLHVKLYGNPDIQFSIKNVDPFITTALPLLHRVPMVLNELPPGFHSVDQLPPNKYILAAK